VGDHDDPNRRGSSRRWINQAVDDSLRRLGTDRIDLYQAHRPDPTTDIAETFSALGALVTEGKILAWGTSTFPAEEIVLAHWAAERRGQAGPHTEQPPYSIMTRGIERHVLPTAQKFGMGVLVWSPLAGGWLTGKHSRSTPPAPDSRAATNPDHFDGGNEAKFGAVEQLSAIAAEAGVRMTHMALAWCVEHPAVTTALIGPRTEQQLDDLLGAAQLRLDADTLDAIDGVVAPGVNINPDDAGWVPSALGIDDRRRPR
jgi:aryl-alcohol dehydrogenase (NADP+)